MDGKYFIALTDASGKCHLLAADVATQEEIRKLDAFMRRWTPLPSKTYGRKTSFSEEDILGTLQKKTGYRFYPVVANYSCKYCEQQMDLPVLNA